MTDASMITFLMVGCQRCGTTWVDAALREHPEVFLPAQKQTYFFDRNYAKGLEWWLANFEGAGPGHKAVGEVATGYCLVEAAPRMALTVPHASLVMTVRHPVDRAYSYFQSRQNEMGWASFEEALEAEPDLRDRGRYIEQVEGLLAHYPRERFLLLFYDDLERDDRGYLRSILRFIGVEEEFRSRQLGQIKNAAMFPRLRRALHGAGLKPVVNAVSRSPVGDVIRRARKRMGARGYAAMRPETRAELAAYFRPFNERLGAFAGRDLSHWSR